MKRIGIAASKIAKDSLLLYNFYVIMLSCLFSLLIFFLCSLSLLAGLALTSTVTRGFVVFEPGTGLTSVFMVCMAVLAIVVGLINLAAILINIRLK
jgi:hypothetical protein